MFGFGDCTPIGQKHRKPSDGRPDHEGGVSKPFQKRLHLEPLEERCLLSTYNVANLNDGVVIGPNQLPGSLRQAIFDANSHNGADTIQIATGLSGAITLSAGELQITDAVSIKGPGAANLAINAAGKSRIFDIDDGDDTSNIAVSISGLTLTGGHASGASRTDSVGGAISSYEKLTLSNSVVTGNTAAGDGGGVYTYNYGATSIVNSRISGNNAGGDGGGIFAEAYNRGTVSIQNSTISGNTAGGNGGGLYADNYGTTTVQSSTISGNNAAGDGGGIWVRTESGAATTIQNSTVSGNTAAGFGGGVYAMNDGTSVIRNSTITGNTTNDEGGGIYNSYSSSLPVTIQSTIVAGNIDTVDTTPDINDTTVTINNSLVGDNTGSNLAEAPAGAPDAQGNQIGSALGQGVIDARLGPLADNGGPTQTCALLGGSPAIGMGSNPAGLTTDQRGTGFPRVLGAQIDVGAYEFDVTTPEIKVLYGTTNVVNGQATPFDFGSVVQNTAGPSKTFTIRNDGGATLNLTTSFASLTHFTVGQPSKTSLAPGETATFTITLKTDTAWTGTQVVSFGNNDGDNGDGVENPFTFGVSGTVIAVGPEISVWDGLTNIPSGQTTPINLGSVIHNTTGPGKTFTISNYGGQPLTLGTISVSGTQFAVVQPAKTSLGAGESTTFTITLKTDVVGTASAQVSFTNNDQDNGDGVESPFAFAVSGTVTPVPPEITLLDGTNNITSGQTTPIGIGSALQYETGPSKTFTIRNDGEQTLNLTLPLASTAHFTVGQPGSASLAPGASTTFTVTLKTNLGWSGSERISTGSNDADNGDGVENPFTFLVSGSVTAAGPEITVWDGSTNLASDQAIVDFGNRRYRKVGPSHTFTIRNDGNQPLALTAPFVSTRHFTVGQPGKMSLAPGESTTFTVTLKTNTLWSGAERVSFGNSDANNGDGIEDPFAFIVSGSVVKLPPEISVFDGATSITSGQTTPIALGSAVRGAVGLTRVFTIRNDGDQSLRLTVPFAGTDHFTVSRPRNTIIAPGRTTTFTVTLKTDAVWSGSETIALVSNSGDATAAVETPFTFVVSGSVMGLPPEITVIDGTKNIVSGSTTPIRLGTAVHNAAGAAKTFTIRNDGNQTLDLTSPFADTPHFTVGAPGRTSLAAGQSTTFAVTLKTDEVWSGSETISLGSNDDANGDGIEIPFTFEVSGSVKKLPAEISVLDGTTSITSGQTTPIVVGDASGNTKTFTIRNDGDKPLRLFVPFANTAHFAVGRPGKPSLAVGQSTTFTVTLKTDAIWSGSETISLGSNDAGDAGAENPFTFVVSGAVTSLPQVVAVLDGSTEIANGGTTPIDLGSAVRTTFGPNVTLVIRNDGDNSLKLTKPFVSTAHFMVGQPDKTTLAAGATATFTVTLNTDSAWSGSEEISFVSTTEDGGNTVEHSFSFWVSGTVTNPLYDLSTIGGYDPTTSVFYLRNTNDTGPANISVAFGPRRGGWEPIVGDWNGDGVFTIGLYDPTTSAFYLRNSNTGGTADVTFRYGSANAGWEPIVGDWDGNGVDTVGLYDPAKSTFYLRNSNTGGIADRIFNYGPGQAGWKPIVGDWTGGGVDTVGLYNAATSRFYLRNSNTSGYADKTFRFGSANTGWQPITGDWTGNGVDTTGLYNPVTGDFHLKYSNNAGDANAAFTYSSAKRDWSPVTGVWTIGNALIAAGGSIAAVPSVPALSQTDLQPIVQEAIARWSAVGLNAAASAKLANVQLVVSDLPGSYLGAMEGDHVRLDLNAAGHGWFVDPTPASDEEFAPTQSNQQMPAIDPRAVDRIDLLTVVEHELGHVLGLDDLAAATNDLMSGLLGAGMRRNLSHQDAIAATLA
jgi:hypothetical protein